MSRLIIILLTLIAAILVLPKTSTEKSLEKKAIRIVGYFAVIVVCILIIVLYQFRESIWKEENIALIVDKFNTSSNVISINKYDLSKVNIEKLVTALQKLKDKNEIVVSKIYTQEQVDKIGMIIQKCDYLNKINFIKLSPNIIAGILATITENIESINLKNNEIQDIDLQQIFNPLQNNKHIKIIQLDNNKITDKSVHLIKSFINSHPNLEHITLAHNKLNIKLLGDT